MSEPQEMPLIDRVKSYASSAAVSQAPWLQLLMSDVISALEEQAARLCEIEEIAESAADVDDGKPNDAMRILVIIRAALA